MQEDIDCRLSGCDVVIGAVTKEAEARCCEGGSQGEEDVRLR